MELHKTLPMFIFLSIPILIINTIAISLAFYDIRKYYKYSTFKPRLVMIALIIFSNYPYSVIFIFPDIFNTGFLNNSFMCQSYHFIASTYNLNYVGLTIITVFISFIMFSNYSIHRLNRIGWLLNIAMGIGFFIIEFIIIPTGGARQVDWADDDTAHAYPKRCLAKGFIAWEGLYCLQTMTSVISLTGAFLFVVANYVLKKFKKGTSSNRIAYSFIMFSITNTFAMVDKVYWAIFRKEPGTIATWIILDLARIVPALYSITYLATEAWGRNKNFNFDMKRVLQLKKCRALYKEYTSEIGARRAYELVSRWEKINSEGEKTYDIMDRKNLNKKEALQYIEKTLEIDLYGFLMTEKFNDYYVTYCLGGKVEANLREGVQAEVV